MRNLLAAAALILAGALIAMPANAQNHRGIDDDHGVEAEGTFAFVDGSDIGDRGEKEIAYGFDAALGKRGGTFRRLMPSVEFGYAATDRLHVALELFAEHFRVRNNPDFANQNRWGGGAAVEFKTLLVPRGEGSTPGVAIALAPHYSSSDDGSGEAATKFALESRLIVDAELVANRLFSAVNLIYEKERARPRGGPWEKGSQFGISAGLSAPLSPAVSVSGELQYFRKYEGYFMNRFLGHALYIGPALHVMLGEHSSITLGWQVQVAGRVRGESGRLDLEHFDRHRVKWSFSTHY